MGVARASPGVRTTKEGRSPAAVIARPTSSSSAGESRSNMSAPSSTNISIRATASSMPCVGRQSVRAKTRMPDSLAASIAARIFMRASSRGRHGLPAAVRGRGVILSSIKIAAAPARP